MHHGPENSQVPLRDRTKRREEVTENHHAGTAKEDAKRKTKESLVGGQFGRLTVTDDLGMKIICRCVCSKVKTYWRGNVIRGLTQSCGCLKKERSQEACKTHGEANRTTEYSIWSSMLTRCYNPKCRAYCNYGGRGIKVCESWRSFTNFLQDMGRANGRTLDRFPDNDGDYTPTNCRWATILEQSNNKRTNRLLTHDGITLSMRDWERRNGFGLNTIYRRLKNGWCVRDAIALPLHQGKKYHFRKSNP